MSDQSHTPEPWQISTNGTGLLPNEAMSTPTFERTAPVFAGRKIVIAIDSDNPLSTQLTMITGDGWNSIDWTDTLKTGEITHKKSGLVVKVLPAMSRYNALLHDIMRLHSTPDNGEYRGCEAEPCAWCEEAKKLTSETVRTLEDTMPTSDANIRQSAEHQKLIADGWKLRGWLPNERLAGLRDELKAQMLQCCHGEEERLVVDRPDGAAVCYYREKSTP